MFGTRNRTRTDPEPPRPRSERGRTGRSLALAFAALIALGALILASRRGDESALEPPF